MARYSTEELAEIGRVTVINSQYTPAKENEFDSIKGFAECIGPHCFVQFKWFTPKGDYRVVSTDYENYSIVYSCSKLLGFYKVEFAWILGRVSDLSSVILSEALGILKAKIPTYDISRLYYTKQGVNGDCRYMSEQQIQDKYY